jgi:hypothetical protein
MIRWAKALFVGLGAYLLIGGVVSRPGVGVALNEYGGTITGGGGTSPSAAVTPNLDLTFEGGGYDALSSTVTIGSTGQTMDFQCFGTNADLTDWNCTNGYTPTLQAGTAPTVDQGVPTAVAADRSVDFNQGGYYQDATETSLGQITTEDFYMEALISMSAGTEVILGTYLAATPYWYLYTTGNRIFWRFDDASGNVNIGGSAGVTTGSWYFTAVCVNRNEASVNGAAVYENGTRAATANPSTVTSTLTAGTPTPFAIGDDNSASFPYAENIAYFGMAKRADWVTAGATGQADCDATARARFAAFVGLFDDTTVSDIADGTSTPTVMTRATDAEVFKADVRYTVGDGWPVFGPLVTDGQFGAWGEVDNMALQSTDLTTSWSELNGADTTDTSSNGDPFGTDTGDGLIADATDTSHGYTQAITLTAAPWTQSVYAKKGDVDFVILDNDTVVNTETWFNLNTGAAATTGAAVISATIEDACPGGVCSGWYRCAITYTGTAASHTIRYIGADTDNDTTYQGDGAAINVILTGMQVELADRVTPPIFTTTGTVQRNAMLLQYKMDDGNGGGDGAVGAMDIVFTLGDFDTQNISYMLHLSDGGVTTDRIAFRTPSSDGTFAFVRKTAGTNGDITGVIDLSDGVEKSSRMTWTTNEMILYTDGAADGPTDSTVTPPLGQDELDVGQSEADANSLNGWINRVRVWDTNVNTDPTTTP